MMCCVPAREVLPRSGELEQEAEQEVEQAFERWCTDSSEEANITSMKYVSDSAASQELLK
jgi:hypothetical protein